MKLKDFLAILNAPVQYQVTDHYDGHKRITNTTTHLDETIYMVYQDDKTGCLIIDIFAN